MLALCRNITTLNRAEELLEEEKNTFLQIIVGEKPPEYFDTFVKKWYENGGKALTQQTDDSYKETMK